MRAAVLIAAWLTVGCYSYRPLTTPTVEPRTSVAATLTDAGALELGPYIGFDAFIVRGRYVSADERGLVLSVTSVETKGGDWHPWGGESVTLPPAAIASLEVRRLAKGRTVLLAGVGMAGLTATTLAFVLTGSGSGISGAGNRPLPK
jgi:hypothetical protein